MGLLDFWKSKPKALEGGSDAVNQVSPAPPSATQATAAAAPPVLPVQPSAGAPPTRTGRRLVNKGEVAADQINVISAQKTSNRDLLYTGDSFDMRKAREESIASGEATTVYSDDPGKKCNVCCMAAGALICGSMALGLSVLHTGIFSYREQHRIRITAAKFCRHAAWMMIPTALCGTTMHYFLCDAFWSKRRNTYGMAWVKAVGMNTAVWGSGIALGTLFWRKGLRLTTFGSKIYYRYPTATESLELRLVENPNALFTGMTWTYWAVGLVTGQIGYLVCAGAVVWQNRTHIMLNPVGSYAKACAPWWRREAIAAATGLTLKRESDRPTRESMLAAETSGDGEPAEGASHGVRRGGTGGSSGPSIAFSAKS
jgi:hypothetical protein